MERQITEEDRKILDNYFRSTTKELMSRTKNVIENPNSENIDLFNKDLQVYRQIRILAERANVDISNYDAQVGACLLQLKTIGGIAR